MKLTKFLQHHSLAQLLVELLLLKIVTATPSGQSNFRDRYSSDIDDKFGNNHNEDSEEEKKN